MVRQSRPSALIVDVDELRDAADSMILDPDTLDSNMHYRWCQMRPQNIARRKRSGYRFVSRSDDGVRTLTEQDDDQGDDKIRLGDLVLMCCPKERRSRRDQTFSNLAEARLGSPEVRFKKKAAGGNVEVVTDLEPKGARED